jgi:hypothetical protein
MNGLNYKKNINDDKYFDRGSVYCIIFGRGHRGPAELQLFFNGAAALELSRAVTISANYFETRTAQGTCLLFACLSALAGPSFTYIDVCAFLFIEPCTQIAISRQHELYEYVYIRSELN